MTSYGRTRQWRRRIAFAAVSLGLGCSSERCSRTTHTGASVATSPVSGGAPGVSLRKPPCAPPDPFDARARYSNTVHVSATGNDSAAGTDSEPLATLRAAARRASPGTRIVMHAGTYRGSTYLENLRGTAEAPIAIVGDGEVILDGAEEPNVLLLVDPRYVVLQDLILQNGSNNGLHINDGGSYDTPAADVVVRHITIRSVGTGGNHDCVKLSGLDRLYMVGSELSSCKSGEAVDMVGCHDAVITGNSFHDIPNNGIVNKGGSSNNLIHGNLFVDVGVRGLSAGGSTALEYFRPMDARYEAANIRMVANILVRTANAIVFSNCDGCKAVNNTIVDPTLRVVRILQESIDPSRFVPCRDGQFKNNIVVFQTGTISDPERVANVGPDTSAETFVFESNLWFATDDTSFSGPKLPSPIPPETGPVVGRAPGFADEGAGNYRVAPSSPAAGAGHRADNLPGDFDGNCWAEPTAIGAFQP
jgi:hypothetical protein